MANTRVFQPRSTGGKTSINDKISFTQLEHSHPRHKIAKMVILCAFIIGCVATILVLVNEWAMCPEKKILNMSEEIKAVWEYFMPIITLVIGYEFGRER